MSGSNVAQGYWNRPSETQETFQAYLATGEGPFLRTGDLGFLKVGELFVTGRIKDLIIIRGRNYYPQDIELVSEKSHPALNAHGGATFSVDIDGEERLTIVQEVQRTFLRKLNVDEVAEAIRQAVQEAYELLVHEIVLLKVICQKPLAAKCNAVLVGRNILMLTLRLWVNGKPRSSKLKRMATRRRVSKIG